MVHPYDPNHMEGRPRILVQNKAKKELGGGGVNSRHLYMQDPGFNSQYQQMHGWVDRQTEKYHRIKVRNVISEREDQAGGPYLESHKGHPQLRVPRILPNPSVKLFHSGLQSSTLPVLL